MEVIQVLGMVAMLAILLLGISKKIDCSLLLAVIGVAAFIVVGLASGTGFIPTITESIGKWATQFVSSWGGSVASICIVFGYLGALNKLNISEYFVSMVTTPVKKVVKNPYVLASTTIIIGALLHMVFNNTNTTALLLVAIWYPVMIACGVTRMTAASAVMIGCTFFRWGPVDILTSMMFEAVGIKDITMTEWWLKYQVPITLVLWVIFIVLFPVLMKFFDKKEKQVVEENVEAAYNKEFDLPKFYAFLPIIPVVLVIITAFVKSISLNLIGCYALCIFLFMVIESIRSKKLVETVNNCVKGIIAGISDAVGPMLIIVAAGVFSSALAACGGMNVLLNLINKVGGGTFPMCVIGLLLIFVVVMISSQSAPNIPVFAVFFQSIANLTGASVYPVINIAATCTGYSSILCLCHPQTLFITEACKVDLGTLIKRMIPFFLVGAVVSFIFTFVIWGI